jgi:hypothetical protein
VYDPTEPIPHADSALAPAKSLIMSRPPLLPTPEPEPEKEEEVVKGSHPRRTYVGIKARRKRLSGLGDDADDEGESSRTGTLSSILEMHGSKSPRVSISHTNPNTNTNISATPNTTNTINANAANTNTNTNTSHFAANKPAARTALLVRQDPHWRRKVYHLAGGLFTHSTSSHPRQGVSKNTTVAAHVCLKGKWLATLEGKPRKEDITNWSNKNEFYFESLAQEDPSALTLPDKSLKPLSGNYTGFHFVEQQASGAGVPTKCTEALIQLLFTAETPGGSGSGSGSNHNYNIVGKGDSDLGKFVLFGHYNSQTRDVEMSRQFVLDSDPCNGLSLQYLRDSHKLDMLARGLSLQGQGQGQGRRPGVPSGLVGGGGEEGLSSGGGAMHSGASGSQRTDLQSNTTAVSVQGSTSGIASSTSDAGDGFAPGPPHASSIALAVSEIGEI